MKQQRKAEQISKKLVHIHRQSQPIRSEKRHNIPHEAKQA